MQLKWLFIPSHILDMENISWPDEFLLKTNNALD